MGKGSGHAPSPYHAAGPGAPASGYNPASWTAHDFGNGQFPMPGMPAPGMPSNAGFGGAQFPPPGMPASGAFGGAQFPPQGNGPPQQTPPLYGQPNPSAGLPSQGMGMNPYRPANDPYDQQQDHFADKAEDKPWKFGPAPGGGLMRLQGGMPGQPMQPGMPPPGMPPMPGHGFGNEQQQPIPPVMQPGGAGGQPAPAYPNHWNLR